MAPVSALCHPKDAQVMCDAIIDKVKEGFSRIFQQSKVTKKPACGPRSAKAAPLVWRNYVFAAISYFEPRPAGPCRFSLNRGVGKVVGKLLIVD